MTSLNTPSTPQVTCTYCELYGLSSYQRKRMMQCQSAGRIAHAPVSIGNMFMTFRT
jgi:hypothetical protein